VEGAAHAFPTMSASSLVGRGSSEAVAFSFYATKPLTTGEGGMVVTSDEQIAARIRTMRLHGINSDIFNRCRNPRPAWYYEVVAPGYKYNLTDPAAAMGRVQLRRSRQMREKQAAIAARYDEAFSGLPLQLPAHAAEGDTHAWHLYVTRLTTDANMDRDVFISEMAKAGVGCGVHFIPLHMHPLWRERYQLDDRQFPVATAEFAKVTSLPIFSGMTALQVDRVIKTVRLVLS
jgi:dTDP-4-amino-4,6-dideoxygalactose transaminase